MSLDDFPRGWAVRQDSRGGVQGQGGVARSSVGQSQALGLGGPVGAPCFSREKGGSERMGTDGWVCGTFLLVSMHLLFLKHFLVLYFFPSFHEM